MSNYKGQNIPDDDPLVKVITEELVMIGMELRSLGNAPGAGPGGRAYLDANCRYFIAKHLVATIAPLRAASEVWWAEFYDNPDNLVVDETVAPRRRTPRP